MISTRTTRELADVLLRHLSTLEAMAMLHEMANVKGNSSFSASIALLLQEVVHRHSGQTSSEPDPDLEPTPDPDPREASL